MIKNYLETTKQAMDSSHDGSGPVDLYEIWEKSDFLSNIDFVDRVVIPPRSTVGTHRHGDNEEMYIVLSGTADMTIEGKAVTVRKGDMILNPPNGEHGLQNNSDDDIDLLVIQVALT